MLGIISDSALDGVNKNLGFAQALTKKGFKSFPANRNVSLVFYLTRVLLPAEQGGIFQKSSCKRNSIWACDTGGGKVIFALLEEIVILQVSFILINVWKLSFQKPLTWAFIVQSGGNSRSRNRCKKSKIQNGPENLREIIFQVSNHREVGRAKSNKRSNDRCNSGNKGICCGGSRAAIVAILGGGSTSKLIFVIVEILAKTATREGLSY